MKRKQRRMIVIATAMTLLAVAAGLVLNAFEDAIVFFYTPSDLAERPPTANQHLRLGGLVEEDSVVRQTDGVTVLFRVTDLSEAVPVTFTGILPDLFREGQGVVAEGIMGADGTFVASDVLAKHDENYMPAEVTEALKKSGQWQGQDQGG